MVTGSIGAAASRAGVPRLAACLLVAALLAGCRGGGSGGQAASDSSSAPPPVSLKDFAGTWQVRSVREDGDSVIGFRLTATADTSGWTMQFPGRPAIAVRVLAQGGDSVVTEAAPYESVLRRGVQVRTGSTLHLRAGRLAGTTIARYSVPGPDSLLRLRNAGSRIN